MSGPQASVQEPIAFVSFWVGEGNVDMRFVGHRYRHRRGLRLTAWRSNQIDLFHRHPVCCLCGCEAVEATFSKPMTWRKVKPSAGLVSHELVVSV